ncbi:glycosyltransferase 87 family protein [Nocardia nova]|uniref:glycosyltransferase 87 family protein n=1 Tax=Nocardia nova TaxID=37330 RepID=UPI0033D27586
MNDRSRVADPDELPGTASAERSSGTLTTRQRRLLMIAIALFVVSAIVSLISHTWGGFIDLQVYRNGARTWLDGGDLYGPMPPVGGIGLPFTYPPLAALFFAPLALMPLIPAQCLVLITSMAALAVTMWLVLDRIRPDMDRTTRLILLIGALAVLGLSEPVRQTYNFGQINLILMVAVALDALVRKPFWPRGMLIGITVSVKLIPGGYLLYFLLRRDWRACATLIGSAVGAIAVGFLLFPSDSTEYWFHTLADTGRIGPPQYAGNQSLKGFAFRLGVSDSAATVIWILLSLIAIGLAALWMKRLLDNGHNVSALLVNSAAVLLVSPVSWSHHWVWVAPALLVAGDLIARMPTGDSTSLRKRRLWIALTTALTVMFMVGPQWLLPHNADRELRWSWWEQIVGSSYVLVAFAALVIAAIAYRPGARKAASAAA